MVLLAENGRERGVEERCGRGRCGSRQFKQPLDTLWMISHFYVTLKPKYFAFLWPFTIFA